MQEAQKLAAAAVRQVLDGTALPAALAAQAAAGAAFSVDLRQQVLCAPDGTQRHFDVDALRRESLLEGLDDIGLTLKHAAAIDAWEAADRAARPWHWLT